MTDELGRAELQLGADLVPFDADLKDAKVRAATTVAEIQAMFDTLRLKVDAQIAGMDAALARTAASSAAGPVSSTTYGSNRNEIWGVRGPDHPGSLQNPLVMVQAAAKYFPMGSYAAAVGDDNASDTTGARSDQSSGLATSAQIAALSEAIHALAQNSAPGHLMAAVGSSGIGEPGAAQRVPIVLDSDSSQALQDMAAAISRLEQHQASGGHTVVVGGLGSGPKNTTFVSGPGGTTTIAGPQGEQVVRIDGPQFAELIAATLARGGGGGGTTNRFYGTGPAQRSVDVYYHRDPTSGAAAAAAPGLLAALGIGTGTLGFAGIGSAASFAGLGFEHFLTTLLGVAGSAAGALGGGGLLALGAAGQTAVGAGSNAAVMKSTITDTMALSTALTQVSAAQQQAYTTGVQYQQAVAQFGVHSTQASQALTTYQSSAAAATAATTALNAQMAALGNTAGVKAELGLAKAGQQLDHFFDLQTSSARVQAVQVMMQAINLGTTMVPLIAQAAERNLAIINTGIRPLFQWLEGPQGIQIWNDLENHFAHDLPTALHAFEQAVELVLRVTDLASGQTGGFITSLDHLATRLNNLDSATLSHDIEHLIGEFRLWETFIKLLAIDIYDLFHQDVGTGNSIIGTFNTLLEKLHAYETSAAGSAAIQNIFMIHKTEVLDLIDVFGKLGAIFGHIYLSVAPALVTVMNDAVLPALKAVADVVAFLAGKSQIVATLLGLALIVSKFGGVGAVGNIVGGASGFLTGAGAGVAGKKITEATIGDLAGAVGGGAAAGAGGEAAIGGLPKLLGLLPGVDAAGVAAAITAALPLVLTGAGAVTVIGLLSRMFPPGGISASASPGHLSVPSTGSPVPVVEGRFGGVGPNLTAPSSETLDIKKIGDYANYSASQLKALIAEIKVYGGVNVNGTNQPKQQVLALAEAALKAKNAWNQSFEEATRAVDLFYRNTSTTLPALYDDFNTNMKLIAHTMGTNSDEGRKLVAQNVQQMVNAVTQGMLAGTVSVSGGMRAIKGALQTGMQDNATTWKQDWTDMFSTLTALYQRGLINTSQYFGSLSSMSKTSLSQIKSETEASYQQTFSNLKQQYDDGLITKGQFDSQVHQANTTATAQERTDMNEWAAQVLTAMTAAGVSSNNGVQAIFKPLNAALTALGQKPLSLVSVGTSDVAQAVSQGVQSLIGPLTGHATGGKVTKPMYMVGEEAPTHAEYVLATNPAYRDRNIGLWASAGRDLGVPGFASGGHLSYAQLEGLWESAGGSKASAPVAAAIAMAESSGNDVMQQGQPFQTTGWGYWQITPGGPQYLDPMTNAQKAVSDWRARGFEPWTTYNDGAYRQFLQGNVAASALGAGAGGTIGTPSVNGKGVLAGIVGHVLSTVAGAANKYLGGAGLSGATTFGGGFAPSGAGGSTAHQAYSALRPERTDQGVDFGGSGGVGAVLAGIVKSVGLWGGWPGTGGLVYSTADGNVYIMEDFAPGVQPGQQLKAGQFVGTAIGGPDGIETGWANAAGTGPLTPYNGSPDGTATSGGQAFRKFIGYAMGGIPGFATGGYLGGIGGVGGSILGGINQANLTNPFASAMGQISSLLGPNGDVNRLTDLMSYWQGMWGLNQNLSSIMSGGPSAAILTDANGNPYIDQVDFNSAVTDLGQEVGWESSIISDLQRALMLSQILPPQIRAQIKVYQAKIAAIKKKIQENLKQMAALQKNINSEQGKKKPNYKAIAGWKNQILTLQNENAQLGGNQTSVGSGGQIGALTGQVTNLQGDLTTLAGYPNQIGGAGGSGFGGQLGPAQISLAQFSQELAALSPAALTTALTTAQASASAGGSSTSALVGLLEQQNLILAQQYEVSQAQYPVLNGMPMYGLPPFGGSFANGGIVPGPMGAPSMILAHGGEKVTPVGAGDTHVHLHGDLERFVDWKIEQAGRTNARTAHRRLPGRGGGYLLPS